MLRAFVLATHAGRRSCETPRLRELEPQPTATSDVCKPQREHVCVHGLSHGERPWALRVIAPTPPRAPPLAVMLRTLARLLVRCFRVRVICVYT